MTILEAFIASRLAAGQGHLWTPGDAKIVRKAFELKSLIAATVEYDRLSALVERESCSLELWGCGVEGLSLCDILNVGDPAAEAAISQRDCRLRHSMTFKSGRVLVCLLGP